MTPIAPQGLHHITAMVRDAQANVDFYTRDLGLTMLKATVNFDDPSVWHFYYGDAAGSPGSVITHFPLPHAGHGKPGTGVTCAAAWAVAPAALEGWLVRLDAAGIAATCSDRMGQTVITLTDPDGMGIEIIGDPAAPGADLWRFHSASLTLDDTRPTAEVLTGLLGLQPAGTDGARSRFALPDGGVIDLVAAPGTPRHRPGAGSIHHIAFRAVDEGDLIAWRDRVAAAGFGVTEVRERQYFRSIYFREPGGVLFEMATDPPGFATDEAPGALGQALKLPPWLEGDRAAIARRLPPVRRPDGVCLP
jgi:glyoxalase family protein